MPMLRRMLINAVAKVAADPELRARAARVLSRDVAPRARAAWRQAKPKLEAARDDLREVAAEVDPRDDPKEFAVRVKERFLGRKARR